MSRKKRRMKGPWQSIQTAIWLIGLAVLFYFDWIWPGILVLVGISILTQAIIQIAVPGSMEEEQPEVEPARVENPSPVKVDPPPASAPEHPTHLLPSECPQCNGPIRGHEVEWTGARSADCPYCGANLPVKNE